jgi:hypothetical protein
MMGRRADEEHDRTLEESFPASDPPASTGITGPRVKDSDRLRQYTKSRAKDTRGDQAHPKGTSTNERHATETAHQREHEDRPRR